MPTENKITAPEESAGVDFGIDGRSVRVSQEAYSIFLAREAAGREKIAALQQRLTAADERADVLEGLLRRSQDFVAFVHKCVRRNGEYAPLHRQEVDELNRDLSDYVEPGVPACEQCRGEGRVGGPAPDEGGGKNCPACDGTGVIEPATDAALKPAEDRNEPNCLLCLDRKTVPSNLLEGHVMDCPDCCGEEG